MFGTTNLFLYFVIFCVGAAIGAMVERIMKGRSAPLPSMPVSDNKHLANQGDIEILGAWRTRSNAVWLEMDGKRLENREALQPEQRQRLLNLVLDLRPWLEAARPPASVSANMPQGPAVPVPGSASQPVQPAVPAPVVAPLPIQANQKKGAPAGEEVKQAVALESIIQQIDKVLQATLATSVYKDRGIQLMEGSGGVVIVKDGANQYEGVDAIPDPEVKNLIRQAVTDWEKGQR